MARQRWRRTPATLAAGLLALGAALLAGCTIGAPPQVATGAVAHAISLLDATSEPQRPVLEEAAAEGRDITYQQYHDAFEAAADCIEAAGVGSVHIDDLGYHDGIRMLALHAEGQGSEPYETEARWCTSTYLSLIEIAYVTQTKAVIVAAHLDAEFQPLLLSCVRAKGLILPDDASIAGILDAERGALPYAPASETCACTTGYAAENGGSCA